MRRYTTPTHYFVFPMNPANYKRIKITYAQNGRTVLEKTELDLIMDETATAYLTLTQEETASFAANVAVTVQVRALTVSDDGNPPKAYASEYMTLSPVSDVLNTEVLK